MKFTIERADFFPAVQTVLNVVSPKATLPIISNILLQLQEKKLTLNATDLDISIQTHLAVSKGEDGAITLPSKKLAEIVRELPDAAITVQVEGKQATIKCGKGKYQLMGMDWEDFPQFPEALGGQVFKMDKSLLAKMIFKTLYSTSKDETRPALNGVLWHIAEAGMRMVATDGHRLAKIDVKQGGPSGLETDIILPAKTLSQLLRLFGDQDGDVEVTVAENHVVFTFAGTTLYSRVIEGTYPNYEQVIPTNNENTLTVDRETLHAAVRRVSILSNSLTHQVKFDLSKSRLELSASDRDIGGEAKDDLEAKYTGENLQIGYNSYYLLEILKHMDSPEVVFELSTSVSAGIMKPSSHPKGEDYLCLIMPLRITDESAEPKT
jgi:DNA polymerase-3 subunit beta